MITVQKPKLVLLLALLLLFNSIEALRSSASSRGGASAEWEVEHDRSYEGYSRRDPNAMAARKMARAQGKASHVRSQVDKHANDVKQMLESHRRTLEQTKTPAMELDMVYGLVESLQRSIPIMKSQDFGDRNLAVSLNILPLNMAPDQSEVSPPETEGKVSKGGAGSQGVDSLVTWPVPRPPSLQTTEVIKKESNAIVGFIDPDTLPASSDVITMSLENNQPVELIMFPKPDCDLRTRDQMLKEGFTVPNDATRVVIHEVGKQMVSLSKPHRGLDRETLIIYKLYFGVLPFTNNPEVKSVDNTLKGLEGPTVSAPPLAMETYEATLNDDASYVRVLTSEPNIWKRSYMNAMHLLFSTWLTTDNTYVAVRNVIRTTPLEQLTVTHVIGDESVVGYRRSYPFLFPFADMDANGRRFNKL